jgi:hypothetical protein
MVRSFLRATDALPGSASGGTTDYYTVTDVIEKESGADYEFLATNFERVDTGETYARKQGEPLIAEQPFWPVLSSGDGHDRILWYRSQLDR